MLRQISNAYLQAEKSEKLWFTDAAMDVFVWLSNEQDITKFQIAYDKPHVEKSFTWTKGEEPYHATIDEGAQPAHHPATPVLNNEVPLDSDKLLKLLETHQGSLPASVLEFIKGCLRVY